MNKRARLNYIHAMSTQVEHKKMYKAKKQWVVAGLSFLVATGLGVVGGQLTTHADTTTSNPTVASVSNKVASGSSNNVSQKSSTSTNSMNPSVATSSSIKPSVSSDGIQHRAEALHGQVVANGINALNKIKNTPVNNSEASSTIKSNGKASAKSSVVSSSNNVSSEMAYLNSLSNAEYSAEVASLKGSSANSTNTNKAINKVADNKLGTNLKTTQQANDTNWIWTNNGYISDGQVHDWKDEGNHFGLNWQYSPTYHAAEFMNGTTENQVHQFFNFTNLINDAKSVKFDKEVKTPNNTNVAGMLQGENALRSIVFGNGFDASNINNMYNMFASDKLVQSIILPNSFNTQNVSDMNQMFYNDPELITIRLPSTLNAQNVSIMRWMFCRDFKLQNINISALKTSHRLNNTVGMFQSDSSLPSLNFSNTFNTTGVNQRGAMFAGLKSLKSLTLPNSVIFPEVSDMSNMFSGLESLKSLTLPNNFTSNKVTNMGAMFAGDNNLQTLNLGTGFNTSNVRTMGHMFSDDYSLKSLNLNSFNTQNVSDMNHMFQFNYALNNLILPNTFSTAKVKDMGAIFDSMPNLKKLTLPASFITKNANSTTDLFGGTYLHSLTIKSNNTKINTNELNGMYKQLPNGKYSDNANDFSKGNIGTFVVGFIAHPISNPNTVMAKNNSNLTNNRWNQNFHFNNPQGQNNDIESIIPHKDSNGNIEYWDVYYLWNPDPGNQGPNAYDEWGQVKASKDFKQFYPVDTNNPVSLNNVAIPNPAYEINGQGRVEVANTTPYDVSFPWRQVAGGSVINNKKANGGQWLTKDQITGNPISPNARLAYFANYGGYDNDPYLAYANPDGKGGYQQFRPYSEQNVFTANQVGAQYGDFRDPYITTNPKNPNQLVAYCAGGINRKIYVLTSSDAVDWTASTPVDVSDLLQNTLHISNGSAETPYVSEINNTPIMFMSEQGSNHNNEGIAYITGTFNNNGIFTTTPNSKQGTVDLGHDVYAGNFAKLNNNQLVFIGWSNNWGYFNGTHAGGFTLPRIINWNSQTSQLESTPVDPAKSSLSDKDDNGNYEVNGKVIISSNKPAKPADNFNITFTRANDNNNHVNFTFNSGKLTVSRNGSANGVTNMNNTVDLDKSKLSSVQFYLDNDTLAAYFPDTKQMYSVLDYDNDRNVPYKLTGIPSNTNLTSYQFEDSATPKKVNNTVAFTDSKTSDLVGSTTVNGALNSNYTINQAPNGYSFIDNDNKITIVNPSQKVNVKVTKNSNTTNSANQDVPVVANTDTDTIDYQYKGVTKGSQQFSGNDQNATDAGDTSIDVNSKAATKMPAGYQLVNKDNSIPYDNGTHNVAIAPIQQTDTIDYQLDGITKGSHQFTGNDVQANGASDTSFDVNNTNDPDIPQGYQLVKPSTTFNYDGGAHNVAIEATNQTANVHYNLPNGTNISSGTISGDVNTSTKPTQAPLGYHFSGNVEPYNFTPANAGNNPSDDVTVTPNTYSGEATLHIKYDLGNGKTVNGSDQKFNVNGQYGQSDMIVNSTQYCPMNDAYQDHNANWLINFDDLTKNGSVSNGKLEHTFTYDATEAPNLVVRYDLINQSSDKLVKSDIHSDTYTASQLGIAPQDWVDGRTITLGTKKNGDTNKLDVINAPAGYHLVDNANGYDYQNAQESIQLEPNATDKTGEKIVLMTMPTGNVAPNNSQSNNNPAKPASNASGSASNAASISMNSTELSSLAKEIGEDINVTVRPNVTNTTNSVDDTTLNSLASEVATNNQEISSLANKPINTTSTTNVNYSYFDNLINNGVDKLTKAINQDFKANLHNVHAQRTHKVTVKRVRKHIKWIMIMKPVKLYNKATLVGTKHGVKTLRPNHEITLNVKAVYKVHNKYVFKVNFKHHNYFITANNDYVRNSYLPLNHNIINRKVRVLNDVYGYKHKNYDKVKTYHKGFVGRIKNIVRLGHYNMTRIQLNNGLWISANKNFIKLV